MKKIENRLGSIERNIVRGNLITLLGIIMFLKTETEDDEGEKLLDATRILLVLAVLLNGVADIVARIKE